MSCFLRSSYDPLPRKFKQGVLSLKSDGATWTEGTSGRGTTVVLPLPLRVRAVLPVGGPGTWTIKKGLFEIVEVDADEGLLELAVPNASRRLVVSRLSEER